MIRHLLIGGAIALSAALLPVAAAAQNPTGPVPVPGDESAGLKLAPTRYETTLEPGKPVEGVVDVFNVSQRALRVQPEVENIRMVGSEGELEFYLGDNPYRLRSFVEFDATPFTLEVGQARRVKFRINVPAGVWPGGYFGSLLFRIIPPEGPAGATSVQQGGRVGSLLILNVEGENDRRGKISALSSFGALLDDRRTFRVSWQNTGHTDQRPLGVAYRPEGKLTIKNMLGLKTAEEKLTGEMVFPGAERKFEVTKRKPLWFGRYTAEVALAPPEVTQPETQRISFWVFSPLGLLIPLLLVLVAVGAWRLKARRTRRRQAK